MELQTIQSKIFEIRGFKVLLDFDLAELYEVETRVLKQAVKRNMDRFPDDFMFKLTKFEWNEVITNCDNLLPTIKFSPVTPYAFTEQGVAMLSSVLNSEHAIRINIAIMRTFVYMRQFALTHHELTEKMKELESKYDTQFANVFDALNYLLQKEHQQTEQKERRKIGYDANNEQLK